MQAATTIAEVFRRNAGVRPHKVAFAMADGRQRTFADLSARVDRLVAALRQAGLLAGDRVAVLAKNRIETIEVYGVSAGGFIPVPLNWRLAPAELAAVLDDSRPAALLFEPGFTVPLESALSRLSFKPMCVAFSDGSDGASDYEKLLAGADGTQAPLVGDPNDVACLLYTSGTTGRPKGAQLTHRGLLANCRAAIDQVLHLTDQDVTLAPMPFFHVGGMWYHLFPSFAAGCTTIVLPEFEPGAVFQLIGKHRVTNMHVVPTMIHALLEQPALAQSDLSSLRLIFYAASSIPVELLRRATQALSHCGFVQGYGSTEGGMISALTEDDHRAAMQPGREHLLLSCGKPIDGVEVSLDTATPDVDGAIGEIRVRSDLTMAGYRQNDAATRAARKDGWLHTGDLGRCDEAGYLYIVDRKSDMIVTGGENVYPREVEDILFDHPAISEAAVFDLPDARWVQKVVAAVVLRPGCNESADDIIAYLKARLASYKCPKQVFIADTLPKSGAGKVLRRVLREQYSDRTPHRS